MSEMKLIVYSNETRKHVATITGGSNEDCERTAEQHYGSNDYSQTYSPAWGMAEGLVESADAETMRAVSIGCAN